MYEYINEKKREAKSLFRSRKLTKAFSIYYELYNQTKNRQYYYYMGKVRFFENKFDDAIYYLKKGFSSIKRAESSALLANIYRDRKEMELCEYYASITEETLRKRYEKRQIEAYTPKDLSLLNYAKNGRTKVEEKEQIMQLVGENFELAACELVNSEPEIDQLLKDGRVVEAQKSIDENKEDFQYTISSIRSLYLSGYERLGDRYLKLVLKKQDKTKQEKEQISFLQKNKKLYLSKATSR